MASSQEQLVGHLSRRHFLGLVVVGAAASGVAPRLPVAASPRLAGQPALSDDPFTLGVASGEPHPDSVVLWTRLAPDPLAGGGMPDADVAVAYEVAADEGFADVVAQGTLDALPEHAHSIHLVVTGLEADRLYWYRFRAGGWDSPVGRTRTAPALGASVARLRFALASCQNWTGGYYTAYAAMADEDLDLVVHVGDYIYEGGGAGVRPHNGDEVFTLAEYRNRYALYKGDEHLRAVHQRFPFVATWDDHEVENNYAGDVSQDGITGPAWLERRAAAYKAWWEHLPVRMAPPTGPDLQIHRTLDWGGLARFCVLDTRQYRDTPVCLVGDGPVYPACPDLDDPTRSMLGADQEAWLAEQLRAGGVSWNVIAQSVVFARLQLFGGFNMDQWDGYVPARQRLLDVLADTSTPCPVVLSGDIHAAGHAALFADAADPTTPVVGTEFVCTAISSSTIGRSFGTTGLGAVLEATVPGLDYANADDNGYLLMTVTPEAVTGDFRVMSTVEQPTATVGTDASVTVTCAELGRGDTPPPPSTTTTTTSAASPVRATPRYTG
ncbi:MAG: alkaline phosphatase D family protein [Acidimicrobiales bacterium]|nr:alkaline phosphatase D family protein [Acidimicrobiales bacterium]